MRSGETVRRTAAAWTPSVQALLRHLRRSGFEQAPVPPGFDAQGREVLEHVEGTVAWWPWPAVLRHGDLTPWNTSWRATSWRR
ncbi:hypothetical protein [Kineococcus sp. SYSU DK003]|uniref:hypothetical protein n=1 Tax=Kineococcus sp. SYSU DK003 TaxID=3383124 RepID=UPI003D7CB3CE